MPTFDHPLPAGTVLENSYGEIIRVICTSEPNDDGPGYVYSVFENDPDLAQPRDLTSVDMERQQDADAHRTWDVKYAPPA